MALPGGDGKDRSFKVSACLVVHTLMRVGGVWRWQQMSTRWWVETGHTDNVLQWQDGLATSRLKCCKR